ncbi:response regulator [Actinomadura nitritigenes]|uniref:response regulator n=1 Tax=Actinomadura nitritigenes TaxID=134602 RepID=UPI0031D946AF
MTEAGAGAPRILVADDDPAVRSALERVLRFNGYEVELAADGLETLEAIDRAVPDAVVLDWTPASPAGRPGRARTRPAPGPTGRRTRRPRRTPR